MNELALTHFKHGTLKSFKKGEVLSGENLRFCVVLEVELKPQLFFNRGRCQIAGS